MATCKVNKGILMIGLLGVAALTACQSRSVQSDGADGSGRDTIAEVVDTISFEYKDCHISQPSLGREIYVGTVGNSDDRLPVVVYSAKTDSRDTIMAEMNDRPLHLLEGKTENEVFILSIGGNGACGWLTKVDVKKKQCKYVELGLGVNDIKKTHEGFLIDRFSKPTWNEEGVWREWTELWDYDLNMVRRFESLQE